MQPKISVIVPCYNGGDFLKPCLQGVLSQDYPNTEVIFVDNESVDRSVEVATQFKESHPDFIIGSAPNLYKYAWEEPVQEAMKIMSGDYFTIVAADDLVAPFYISEVVKLIEKEGDMQCFQTALRNLNPDGGLAPAAAHQYSGMEEFKDSLLKHCSVHTPTVVYNRELYDEGHVYWVADKYLGAADYDMYCSFADKGIYIHTFYTWLGYVYRVHEAQSTWGMVEEASKGNVFDHKIQSFWRKQWKK